MTKLDEALGLFPSVIKSGEHWSATCQAVLDAAKSELAELRAGVAQGRGEPHEATYLRGWNAGIEECIKAVAAVMRIEPWSAGGPLFEALRALCSVTSTDKLCAKCGCETKGEAALVGDEVWCHPCADAQSDASTTRCDTCASTGIVGRRYAPDWKLVDEPCPHCAPEPSTLHSDPPVPSTDKGLSAEEKRDRAQALAHARSMSSTLNSDPETATGLNKKFPYNVEGMGK